MSSHRVVFLSRFRFEVLTTRGYCVAARRNHYDILGIQRTATLQEIKEAFYALSKTSHPDIAGTESKLFLDIKEAYDTLKDETSRQAYDHRLDYDFSSPAFSESLRFRKRSYEFGQGDNFPEMHNVNFETIDLSSRYGHFYDPNEEVASERRNRNITIVAILLFVVLIGANILYIHYLFNKQNRRNQSFSDTQINN